MRKKFVGITLLAFIFIISVMSLFACEKGCGKEVAIKLKDFPETAEVEVSLGDTYNLRTVVESEDGVTYPLSYSVAKANGETVSTMANKLNINSADGYIITYIADLSSEGVDNPKSIITLKIKDGDEPIITIGTASVGEVNAQYALPTYSVKTYSTISSEKVEVRFVENGVESETVETLSGNDKTFTPAKSGVYHMTVSVTTTLGKTTKSTKEIFVAAENEIFNAGEPLAATRLTILPNEVFISQFRKGDEGYDGGEYDGSYLTFKLTANEVKDSVYFVFNTLIADRSINDFSEYDMVSMWVYGETKDSSQSTFSLRPIASFVDKYAKNVESGVWTNIKLPMSAFIENYNFTEYNAETKKNEENSWVTRNLLSVDMRELKELRIGSVTAEVGEKEPAEIGNNIAMVNDYFGKNVYGAEIIGFNNESNMLAQIKNKDHADLTYLSADDAKVPEGGYGGVAKLKFSWEWPRFYFSPAAEKSAYENCTHIVIRMYIDGSVDYLRFGYHHGSDFGTEDGGTYDIQQYVSDCSNEWFNVIIPIDEFLDKYNDYVAGNKGLFFCLGGDEQAAKSYTMYIDGIYAVKLDKSAPVIGDSSKISVLDSLGTGVTGAEIEGCNDPTSVTSFSSGHGSIRYLSADNASIPEGANGGVIEFDMRFAWPLLKVKPLGNSAIYEGYTKILVRAYFKSYIPARCNMGDGDLEAGRVWADSSWATDKWINMIFDISDLTTNFSGYENGERGVWFNMSDEGNLATVYIDGIYAIKTSAKATRTAIVGDSSVIPALSSLGTGVTGAEIVSCNDEISAGLLSSSSSNGTLTYLAEGDSSIPAGANGGVVKFDINYAWPDIFFTPIGDEELYSDYTHIVIRLYIGNLTINNRCMFGSTGGDTYVNKDEETETKKTIGTAIWTGDYTKDSNGWYNFTISIDEFKNNFTDYKNGKRCLWLNFPEQTTGAIYLDGIYAYKQA